MNDNLALVPNNVLYCWDILSQSGIKLTQTNLKNGVLDYHIIADIYDSRNFFAPRG